ncbi:methionine--tRNA ligase [Striga asiatica]|uniref:Methionine--tRNA ligase n=1 Tax=Striga asiatica TaxID=4170 RepID=A0A5A7PW48_STRAF|nr:methionine--tRNA ligase [Striga asiatica]
MAACSHNIYNHLQELYLDNANKEECHRTRKSHVYHGKCYRKWKVEVLRRKNPLQSISQFQHSKCPLKQVASTAGLRSFPLDKFGLSSIESQGSDRCSNNQFQTFKSITKLHLLLTRNRCAKPEKAELMSKDLEFNKKMEPKSMEKLYARNSTFNTHPLHERAENT